MNAETVLRIKPALTEYLHEFDGGFGRVSRRHLDTYVQGQLGPLERKSVEPIADAAGPPPRASASATQRVPLPQAADSEPSMLYIRSAASAPAIPFPARSGRRKRASATSR